MPVDQRKQTTAIVFVDMAGVPPSARRSKLLVTLSAHIGGRQLSGPIKKRVSNPAASSTAWVTAAERTTDRFGVSFDVPAAWLASEGCGSRRASRFPSRQQRPGCANAHAC